MPIDAFAATSPELDLDPATVAFAAATGAIDRYDLPRR
jgi:hypothetical protein